MVSLNNDKVDWVGRNADIMNEGTKGGEMRILWMRVQGGRNADIMNEGTKGEKKDWPLILGE